MQDIGAKKAKKAKRKQEERGGATKAIEQFAGRGASRKKLSTLSKVAANRLGSGSVLGG